MGTQVRGLAVGNFLSLYSKFESQCACLSLSRCLTCLLGLQGVQWIWELVVVRVRWFWHLGLYIYKKSKRWWNEQLTPNLVGNSWNFLGFVYSNSIYFFFREEAYHDPNYWGLILSFFFKSRDPANRTSNDVPLGSM